MPHALQTPDQQKEIEFIDLYLLVVFHNFEVDEALFLFVSDHDVSSCGAKTSLNHQIFVRQFLFSMYFLPSLPSLGFCGSFDFWLESTESCLDSSPCLPLEYPLSSPHPAMSDRAKPVLGTTGLLESAIVLPL